ncbi:hypothetical protein [Flavobacterium sp. N3904]|uniref:hypothetical protein n=1 Tax=Flavobacterium sp. N3904 TaxID=2986835 RepID=UPI0022251610|nr:hypothetical protein [Flavobacterium sp. N3904]
MKKIMILLAVVGMFGFQGCTGPEGPPGQDAPLPSAFEIVNQDLFRVTDNFYSVSNTFKNEVGIDLYGTDTILVYRLSNNSNPSLPVWQLIPTTIYLDNGEDIYYDFDFTSKDYVISANATFNLAGSLFIKSQTFRVVIVPNDLIGSVNKNNYNEVMSVLKISESQVKKIDL